MCNANVFKSVGRLTANIVCKLTIKQLSNNPNVLLLLFTPINWSYEFLIQVITYCKMKLDFNNYSWNDSLRLDNIKRRSSLNNLYVGKYKRNILMISNSSSKKRIKTGLIDTKLHKSRYSAKNASRHNILHCF